MTKSTPDWGSTFLTHGQVSYIYGLDSEKKATFLYLSPSTQDPKIVATHRLLDEGINAWTDSTIHIRYEEIENYLIQTNQLIDAATGNTLREGNNIVIYLKAESGDGE